MRTTRPTTPGSPPKRRIQEVVRQDEKVARLRLVLLRREGPPKHGRGPDHLEEARLHAQDPDLLREGLEEGHDRLVEGGHLLEGPLPVAVGLVGVAGDPPGRGAPVAPEEDHHPVRLGKRQRPEEHRVHHPPDHRAAGDPHGHHGEGEGGEEGTARGLAGRVPQVRAKPVQALTAALAPGAHAALPHRLTPPGLGIAEAGERPPSRLVGGMALGEEGLGQLLQMEADLLLDGLLLLPLAEGIAEDQSPARKGDHRAGSAAMARSTARAYRPQMRSCASSRARPAGVIS